MATPPPPLRRATILLVAVLVGVLASTARADLVITRADRRVSAVLIALQISEPNSHLSLSRLNALGSNAARVLVSLLAG